MKRKMVARREIKYGTRHFVAGDVFEAVGGHGRVFSKLGWADYIDEGRPRATIPPIPDSLKDRAMAGKPVDHDGDDIRALRADYSEKVGKRPFPGWDAEELRRRMAEVAA